jgi:hypothetical protein
MAVVAKLHGARPQKVHILARARTLSLSLTHTHPQTHKQNLPLPPPPPLTARLCHNYSVASFATLRVASCLYLPGLCSSCCNTVRSFSDQEACNFMVIKLILLKKKPSLTWSTGLLDKLVVVQLVKKFQTFYGTGRFITVFTTTRYWVLP